MNNTVHLKPRTVVFLTSDRTQRHTCEGVKLSR